MKHKTVNQLTGGDAKSVSPGRARAATLAAAAGHPLQSRPTGYSTAHGAPTSAVSGSFKDAVGPGALSSLPNAQPDKG